MFTTIIITKPAFFNGEAARIAAFLRQGTAGLVHIRKPGATADEVERLIREIPEEYHCRLVLHDHFQLAARYGLYGVHLNSRNPAPPQGWTGSVSRSCHTLEEVKEWKERCRYMSLSPIYDSISKQGYRAAFTAADIREAARQGIINNKVYALGGITFARLPEVKAQGFGGAMILGDAWRANRPQNRKP